MADSNKPIELGKLTYDPSKIIGQGNFGVVFKGSSRETFFGPEKEVAVKRIPKNYINKSFAHNEVELMKKAGDHINILRYISTQTDENFLYIATELCRGTLKDYFGNGYQGPRFSSEWQIVYQVTQGLSHLHNKDIVHRDIKPNNILIFVPTEGLETDLQVKLADFGISKILKADQNDFSNTSVTNPSGTRGWMPPEVYEDDRFDFKVDIWALGCIFGYTLSEGKNHPFGNEEHKRNSRILQKEDMELTPRDLKRPYSDDRLGFELIKSMLESEPTMRPGTKKILESSFFKIDPVRTKQLLDFCRSFSGSETENGVQLEKLLKLNPVGLNVNTKTLNGWTPLHFLCFTYKKTNMIALVRLLIQKGAEINAKARDGETPLHVLCRQDTNNDLFDLVKHLMEKGAQVNAETQDRRTPLHILCASYKNEDLIRIVQLFIKFGANVKSRTGDGENLLHLLCKHYGNNNLIDIVKLLVDNGADVNAKNRDGRNPLHLLCLYYKNDHLYELVKLFSQKGGDDVNHAKKGIWQLLIIFFCMGFLCCFYALFLIASIQKSNMDTEQL